MSQALVKHYFSIWFLSYYKVLPNVVNQWTSRVPALWTPGQSQASRFPPPPASTPSQANCLPQLRTQARTTEPPVNGQTIQKWFQHCKLTPPPVPRWMQQRTRTLHWTHCTHRAASELWLTDPASVVTSVWSRLTETHPDTALCLWRTEAVSPATPPSVDYPPSIFLGKIIMN